MRLTDSPPLNRISFHRKFPSAVDRAGILTHSLRRGQKEPVWVKFNQHIGHPITSGHDIYTLIDFGQANKK